MTHPQTRLPLEEGTDVLILGRAPDVIHAYGRRGTVASVGHAGYAVDVPAWPGRAIISPVRRPGGPPNRPAPR